MNPTPRIYLSPPHVTGNERELMLDAFDSNWIAPLGPHVDAFERELAAKVGVSHAAALSSGTAGLHLALMLLGVEAGDVVLTSSLTFAATANAICYVGAVPAFVDCSAATWTMDPDLLEEALASLKKANRRVGAIITVDLYGQCCDYDRITRIAAEYDVPIIEDAAEALGATCAGRPAGSFAELAVFSFNGNKIITTSGGGMLVGNSEQHIKRARHLSTQAREPAAHYEHRDVGYNYRMSNILAAIGRGQLADLDARVERRRDHNGFYRRALGNNAGFAFMPEAPYGRSTFWLTCLTIDSARAGFSREELRLYLETHNIESRPVWKPMHLQPVFAGMQVFGGATAAQLFRERTVLAEWLESQ